MSAYLFIRSKVQLREHQLDLGKLALGNSQNSEAINKQLRDWENQLK